MINRLQLLMMAVFITWAAPSWAESPMIYEKQVKGNMEETYKQVFESLENNGYFVVF